MFTWAKVLALIYDLFHAFKLYLAKQKGVSEERQRVNDAAETRRDAARKAGEEADKATDQEVDDYWTGREK